MLTSVFSKIKDLAKLKLMFMWGNYQLLVRNIASMHA